MATVIDAIESGDLEAVLRALGDGREAGRARKRIVLECRVLISRYTLRPDEFKDLQDTADGESALGLAILTGRSELVRALLEAGADVNSAISWKIPGGDAQWTKEVWEKHRWHIVYTAPSALDFALGGIRVSFPDGVLAQKQQSEFDDTGRLLISKAGSVVTLRDPSSPSASYRRATLVPNLDIVSLLLDYGAFVTQTCRDAAKRLSDRRRPRLPEFAELLANQQPNGSVRVRSNRDPSVSSGSGLVPSSRQYDEPRRDSDIESLRREFAALKQAVKGQSPPTDYRPLSDLERRALSLAERERDQYRTELAAAEQDREQLRIENEQLSSLYRHLYRENEYLRQLHESSEPRSHRDPLPVYRLYIVKMNFEKESSECIRLEAGQRVFCYAEYENTWGWLLVFGGTGRQGGATIDALLKRYADKFSIRTITRQVDSPKARKLAARNVEVLSGDTEDGTGLEEAMRGVWGVYFVTDPRGNKGGPEAVAKQGINVVELAFRAGVSYFVFSSIAAVDMEESKTVPHISCKLPIENAVTSKAWPVGFSIIRPAGFFDSLVMQGPLKRGALTFLTPPNLKVKFVSLEDIGLFSAMAFGMVDEFNGKKLELAGDDVSGEDMATILSELTAEPWSYTQLPSWLLNLISRDLYAMIMAFDHTMPKLEIDYATLRRLHPKLQSFRDWCVAIGIGKQGEGDAKEESGKAREGEQKRRAAREREIMKASGMNSGWERGLKERDGGKTQEWRGEQEIHAQISIVESRRKSNGIEKRARVGEAGPSTTSLPSPSPMTPPPVSVLVSPCSSYPPAVPAGLAPAPPLVSRQLPLSPKTTHELATHCVDSLLSPHLVHGVDGGTEPGGALCGGVTGTTNGSTLVDGGRWAPLVPPVPLALFRAGACTGAQVEQKDNANEKSQIARRSHAKLLHGTELGGRGETLEGGMIIEVVESKEHQGNEEILMWQLDVGTLGGDQTLLPSTPDVPPSPKPTPLPAPPTTLPQRTPSLTLPLPPHLDPATWTYYLIRSCQFNIPRSSVFLSLIDHSAFSFPLNPLCLVKLRAIILRSRIAHDQDAHSRSYDPPLVNLGRERHCGAVCTSQALRQDDETEQVGQTPTTFATRSLNSHFELTSSMTRHAGFPKHDSKLDIHLHPTSPSPPPAPLPLSLHPSTRALLLALLPMYVLPLLRSHLPPTRTIWDAKRDVKSWGIEMLRCGDEVRNVEKEVREVGAKEREWRVSCGKVMQQGARKGRQADAEVKIVINSEVAMKVDTKMELGMGMRTEMVKQRVSEVSLDIRMKAVGHHLEQKVGTRSTPTPSAEPDQTPARPAPNLQTHLHTPLDPRTHPRLSASPTTLRTHACRPNAAGELLVNNEQGLVTFESVDEAEVPPDFDRSWHGGRRTGGGAVGGWRTWVNRHEDEIVDDDLEVNTSQRLRKEEELGLTGESEAHHPEHTNHAPHTEHTYYEQSAPPPPTIISALPLHEHEQEPAERHEDNIVHAHSLTPILFAMVNTKADGTKTQIRHQQRQQPTQQPHHSNTDTQTPVVNAVVVSETSSHVCRLRSAHSPRRFSPPYADPLTPTEHPKLTQIPASTVAVASARAHLFLSHGSIGLDTLDSSAMRAQPLMARIHTGAGAQLRKCARIDKPLTPLTPPLHTQIWSIGRDGEEIASQHAKHSPDLGTLPSSQELFSRAETLPDILGSPSPSTLTLVSFPTPPSPERECRDIRKVEESCSRAEEYSEADKKSRWMMAMDSAGGSDTCSTRPVTPVLAKARSYPVARHNPFLAPRKALLVPRPHPIVVDRLGPRAVGGWFGVAEDGDVEEEEVAISEMWYGRLEWDGEGGEVEGGKGEEEVRLEEHGACGGSGIRFDGVEDGQVTEIGEEDFEGLPPLPRRGPAAGWIGEVGEWQEDGAAWVVGWSGGVGGVVEQILEEDANARCGRANRTSQGQGGAWVGEGSEDWRRRTGGGGEFMEEIRQIEDEVVESMLNRTLADLALSTCRAVATPVPPSAPLSSKARGTTSARARRQRCVGGNVGRVVNGGGEVDLSMVEGGRDSGKKDVNDTGDLDGMVNVDLEDWVFRSDGGSREHGGGDIEMDCEQASSTPLAATVVLPSISSSPEPCTSPSTTVRHMSPTSETCETGGPQCLTVEQREGLEALLEWLEQHMTERRSSERAKRCLEDNGRESLLLTEDSEDGYTRFAPLLSESFVGTLCIAPPPPSTYTALHTRLTSLASQLPPLRRSFLATKAEFRRAQGHLEALERDYEDKKAREKGAVKERREKGKFSRAWGLSGKGIPGRGLNGRVGGWDGEREELSGGNGTGGEGGTRLGKGRYAEWGKRRRLDHAAMVIVVDDLEDGELMEDADRPLVA
ncbi:hypothetical protein HDU93_008255 [Gonapodya sp. JEL0774]|nr:hypothetical protein HDU93_008255 [Gonapodya sp. JEL0774]